jgi:hypothetical protein
LRILIFLLNILFKKNAWSIWIWIVLLKPNIQLGIRKWIENTWDHIIKIWPVPAGRSWTSSTRGWNQAKLKKKHEKKKLSWPGDLVDSAKSGQKPDCNPLTFLLFFTKTTSFWLKKKLTWATGSKPETRILNQADNQAGSKNYAWDD